MNWSPPSLGTKCCLPVHPICRAAGSRNASPHTLLTYFGLGSERPHPYAPPSRGATSALPPKVRLLTSYRTSCSARLHFVRSFGASSRRGVAVTLMSAELMLSLRRAAGSAPLPQAAALAWCVGPCGLGQTQRARSRQPSRISALQSAVGRLPLRAASLCRTRGAVWPTGEASCPRRSPHCSHSISSWSAPVASVLTGCSRPRPRSSGDSGGPSRTIAVYRLCLRPAVLVWGRM